MQIDFSYKMSIQQKHFDSFMRGHESFDKRLAQCLRKHGYEPSDAITLCWGWLGNEIDGIVRKWHKRPTGETTGWEPYYIELKRLSSGDYLLYESNGSFGVFQMDYLILDGRQVIGLYNIMGNKMLPFKDVSFDKYRWAKYNVIVNLTFQSYVWASNTIKNAWKEYKRSKSENLKG